MPTPTQEAPLPLARDEIALLGDGLPAIEELLWVLDCCCRTGVIRASCLFGLRFCCCMSFYREFTSLVGLCFVAEDIFIVYCMFDSLSLPGFENMPLLLFILCMLDRTGENKLLIDPRPGPSLTPAPW